MNKVARAYADESGNNFKSSYAAAVNTSITASSVPIGRHFDLLQITLKSKNNTTISNGTDYFGISEEGNGVLLTKISNGVYELPEEYNAKYISFSGTAGPSSSGSVKFHIPVFKCYTFSLGGGTYTDYYSGIKQVNLSFYISTTEHRLYIFNGSSLATYTAGVRVYQWFTR